MKWTGERIRSLRLRLGWSQAELARRLGCRQQTVSEWETDIYAPLNAYSQLLDHLTAQVDRYSSHLNRLPHAEVAMRELGISQISSDHDAIKITEVSDETSSPTDSQLSSN